MHLLLTAASLLLCQSEPGPLSPKDSLAAIKTRPGFVVELMASEPVVQSPIAFAWGEDGKLWVVEMGDYPLGVDGRGKPGGKIKYLTRSKEPGPYDQATVFLDGLSFPTGVFPWKKGVLVSCAPDIFYAEDTDGDGKADKKEILYTGFVEGNQQHRVNGFVWGLDNWLYCANGDSGGKIKSIKTGQVVEIKGRDFRIEPESGKIETQSGQSQFGRTRDDWGNWFGCNNSNPLFHFVLDDHYLKRNPHVVYPDPKVPVSVKPGAAQVYPISKPQARYNNPQSLNHFTSACGAVIYRDDLFGPEFYGNSFVSEPVHNLIHREILKPKGLTFTSQRADDEKESEFLASTDNWFRPAMLQVGPDGALWIADMYRHVIEHPQWIPEEWQRKLDLRAGHDKGRIYRVYSKGKTPRAIPNLARLGSLALVDSLDSPSGWQRDTVQRLLLNVEAERVQEALRKMLVSAENPQTRLHALCTLYGLGVSYTSLKASLGDKHPSVVKQAIRCAERDDALLKFSEAEIDSLVKHADFGVVQQLAYSLGKTNHALRDKRLAEILLANLEDRHLTASCLSSMSESSWSGIVEEIAAKGRVPDSLLPALLKMAGGFRKPGEAAPLVFADIAQTVDNTGQIDFRRMAELIRRIDSSGLDWVDLLKHASSPTLAHLKQYQTSGRALLSGGPNEQTKDAIVAVGREPEFWANDIKLLANFLSVQTPADVQESAIKRLAGIPYPFLPRQLIERWKTLGPSTRPQALELLLSRPVWTQQMLDAIAAGKIPSSEIDPIRRQLLLSHPDGSLRAQAEKILQSSSSPDRAKVINAYLLAAISSGNAEKGQAIFVKNCASCHQLGKVGQPVGPDLLSVKDKSPQGLLTAILDPNRAVEARYLNYVAVTNKGQTLNGLIVAETSTSLTLVAADGKKTDLLRGELEDFASTGRSFMPEGFEREITPEAMADLIEFVRTAKGSREK